MDHSNEEVCLISKELDLITSLQIPYSDSETICSSCSPLEFSKIYEQEMDNQLEKFACYISQESEKAKKKRGRKPLRPNDPIRKKTEIKDKYWLRAFRNFIKAHFGLVNRSLTAKQAEFWEFYISKEGKPGKEGTFLSYGKSYKGFLFAEKSFKQLFKAWLLEFGYKELSKKHEPGTDMWFIYWDYALKEIASEGNSFELYQDLIKGKSKQLEINEAVDFFFN